MFFRLIHCIAKAVAKNGVKFVCGLVPGGDVLYDIAAEAWGDYRQDGQENALRAELEALAQAGADKVHQAVREALKAVASGLPPAVQKALEAYLNQIPAAIRSTLRRPSDPTGTTVPPALSLSGPAGLVSFLPPRPPRFAPGDHPLPGVDLVLEELLGAGGFGEVWKARAEYLSAKPPVALKFCLDAAAVPALRNEAGVLNRVMLHGRHPGIVPLIQTYLSAEPPFLEYEYVEGGDLAGLLRELHDRRQMTPDLATQLVLRLAEIVAHAHGANPPIVHGDLKPANVLVRQTDGKVRLRVTDFGIGALAAAQAAQETRQPTHSRPVLMTEAVKGAYTPLYASPQQMARRPGEPADQRDDVHALGVIWYQAVTGDLAATNVPPDWQDDVRERGLSEGLIKLLASCMAGKAEKRPADAAVPAKALRDSIGPPRTPKQSGTAGHGQQANSNVTQEHVKIDEPPAPSFPVVQSGEEIDANMRRLEGYLQSARGEEREFATDLIRKARCIVISTRGGLVRVGPSRFVGYADNSIQKHQENIYKDGKETNPAISKALHLDLVADPAVEQEYQEFCRTHQIENLSRARRKFWRVR